MEYRGITRRAIFQERMDYRDTKKHSTTNNPSSQDTIERNEIHKNIIELIKQGKSETEILHFLNEKYATSNLKCYFTKWIQHHCDKYNESR